MPTAQRSPSLTAVANPPVTPPPVPKLGVVKLSTSVARALSSGTAEVSTARFPVGSVPATETIKRPDTEAQLSRTSVSVGPESSSVPLVVRSEEHTSELQSRLHLVCRLLLEKKIEQLAGIRLVVDGHHRRARLERRRARDVSVD